MEDLNAASLEDVKEWFQHLLRRRPTPCSCWPATSTPETRQAKVEKYFGDIPPGPPVARHEAWIAKRTGDAAPDACRTACPQARIYKVWNVPAVGHRPTRDLPRPGRATCSASGKTSRLYKRLVYDEQIATDVSAPPSTRARSAASSCIMADRAARASTWPRSRRRSTRSWRAFLQGRPDRRRTRAGQDAAPRRLHPRRRAHRRLRRQVRRAGAGRGLRRRPGRLQGDAQAASRGATPAAVQRRGRAVALRRRSTSSRCSRSPSYATTPATVDRSKRCRSRARRPTCSFPALERATLSNGLKLILAERHVVPHGGLRRCSSTPATPPTSSRSPGTASLAMDMLDEGTTTRSSARRSATSSRRLGATLAPGADLDTSYVSAVGAEGQARPVARALRRRHPESRRSRQTDFERLRKQPARADPAGEGRSRSAWRCACCPGCSTAQGHAYAQPLTGSGTEDSVGKITRDDLVKFHQTWFKPEQRHADRRRATPRWPRSSRSSRSSSAPGSPARCRRRTSRTVAVPAKPTVYLIDRPGAEQSVILAGHVAPPKANPDEIAIETMNAILGGEFTSRLNMNLREDKHWSYGARTLFLRRPRPAAVHRLSRRCRPTRPRSRSARSSKELRGILGERPVTAEELGAGEERAAR